MQSRIIKSASTIAIHNTFLSHWRFIVYARPRSWVTVDSFLAHWQNAEIISRIMQVRQFSHPSSCLSMCSRRISQIRPNTCMLSPRSRETLRQWTERNWIWSHGLKRASPCLDYDVNRRTLSPTLIVTALLHVTPFALRALCAVTYGIHQESYRGFCIRGYRWDTMLQLHARWITVLCFRSRRKWIVCFKCRNSEWFTVPALTIDWERSCCFRETKE